MCNFMAVNNHKQLASCYLTQLRTSIPWGGFDSLVVVAWSLGMTPDVAVGFGTLDTED